MAINIDINQEKLAEIMAFTKFKSKKQAVNTALDEYLKILVGKELLKLEGSNVWQGDLDKMRQD
jgi:Arc/MetJ family transcription regulator